MANPVASTSSLELLPLSVTYSGATKDFALDGSATVADLIRELDDHFQVAPNVQKLILKGRKVSMDDPDIELRSIIAPRAKLLLIGAKRSDMDAVDKEQDARRRKKSAYEYHALHKTTVRNTTDPSQLMEVAMYKFHSIQPFPATVPSVEAREKMLNRLANDPAIKHIMVKHKYAVGVLTELNPHSDPTLLGLNKNAGEQVCLRLLTNDLEGTRSYLEVRKVLIHELAHNTFGPHDNSFKELNSLMNKEVIEFEVARGVATVPGSAMAWEPAGVENEEEMEERRVRHSHVLGEKENERFVTRLRFSPEDEVDEKRERMLRAAVDRQREASQGETP